MEDGSETRDSCYFPGCRKDANCNCDMCLASINATLDLMPTSVQRSSLTNFSASKRVPRSPVSFNSLVMSTPTRSSTVSPPDKFHSENEFSREDEKEQERVGFWVYADEIDTVKDIGKKPWVFQDLNERLEFLQEELQGLVHGKVSNCSAIDSVWEINQDGLLLNSRCTLYKSATEEVSIWGWPLQTAGLLTTEFSSLSFTVLSGRVTEWSDGKVKYSIRKANSSWAQERWSASVVQSDPNTWILEYRQSLVMENSRLLSAALEFLRFRLSRELKKMKQEVWMLSAFGRQYSDFTEDSFKIPT
ncbi:hypothetical protein F0562_034986 [Nyssa sinensis]|uniref:Uncharacterized protein n=1 Tax=Nyssa sinensis TaxID=561372 RepID=A0A5J5ABE2_9ASTE|nr:hypothetical protein F0562_034986 [Nyssa sinensis]